MVYFKSVENVITLGKLIGLLFLFCLPLLSILFLKTKRNDLARPVMGTNFLVNDRCGSLPSSFTGIFFLKGVGGSREFLPHLPPNYEAISHKKLTYSPPPKFQNTTCFQ